MNPRWLGGTFSAQVHGAAGQTYILECKDSLDDPTWTEVDIVTGQDALQTLTDTSASLAQRFYRVRMQ